MFNMPFGQNEIQALLRQLSGSPLLVALFLISPPDALNYLGFGLFAPLFEAFRPTNPADIERVRQILQALAQGRTTLEQTQLVQPAAEEPPPPPATVTLATPQPADVRLGVANTTLQHMLALYTRHSFAGQTFSLPAQNWGELRAVGESLRMELTNGQVRITATLQGTAQLRLPLPLGRSVDLGAIASPVTVDILTTCAIGADDLLALNVRQGEIRLAQVPLPEVAARELARQLVAAMPSIPIVKVPTSFEVPDAQGQVADVVKLAAREVRVEPEGIWLQFEIV